MFSQQPLTNCRTKIRKEKKKRKNQQKDVNSAVVSISWMSRSRAIYTYRVHTLMEEIYSSLYETKKNNHLNETERSCQFLKSILGTMRATWQVACSPSQPETQEEKQVWHLLGCLSPKIYSTSWKCIKTRRKQRSYKTKEIVQFPAKPFSEFTTEDIFVNNP